MADDTETALPLNLITTPIAAADPLAELATLIGSASRTPEIGMKASQAMMQCFEATATEIERLAQDGLDRAMENQQEARSYASVLRQSGELLCRKIEAEAGRTRQIALVMGEARAKLAAPEPPGAPPTSN